MKIKKVDIKVEYLDTDCNRSYLRVAKLPERYPTQILDENKYPDYSTCRIETLEYPILKMYHPEKGEFFMAVQDKDLFETLMEFRKGRETVLKEGVVKMAIILDLEKVI